MHKFIRYKITYFLFIIILFQGAALYASSHQDEIKESVDTPTEIRQKELTPEPALKGELDIKIGVVDLQRIIDESKKGKEARRYFEGLTSLRSMEELAKTEEELIGQIIQDIEIIIGEYAKENRFTHIIDVLEGGVLYVDEAFSITGKIIELYDEKVEIQ